MDKISIKNRKNQKISVVIQEVENPVGLVFIMHGLGGSKNQPIIEICAEVFLERNYNTIRFDATNTFGESDGNYENATTTNYYEDLEDVINWVKSNDFYQEPFVLAGHSLGGIAVALYAENHPEKVKAISLLSTVVSGELSLKNNPEAIMEWQRTGWRISERKSKPGTFKKIPWSHMEDRLKYNLLTQVRKITMPTLLVAGENDESTPVGHQKILYEALPSDKKFYVIKDADHVFSKPKHLKEVKEILNNWINKI
ncbi:MAG: alpha/beta hydrolase [Candidatus Pacebacteria bacterium]|nr:alpha/beta hydrolase [Candidatus Paceibacterota bacterium]